MGDKESIKLCNQLCFPLYACAKEIVRKYKPFLEPLDLTYTQYIAMMVLWEEKEITVKALGERIYLDSGTLTPLLKKLEAKGYVQRIKSKEDERSLIIKLTDAGMALSNDACGIPAQIGSCVNISKEEAATLYRILYKILGDI